MLSDHEDIIEIPCEETINEILERYKEINEHAGSYTWRRGRGNIIWGGGLANINSVISTNSVTVYGAIDVVCEAIVHALDTFKEVTKCPGRAYAIN